MKSQSYLSKSANLLWSLTRTLPSNSITVVIKVLNIDVHARHILCRNLFMVLNNILEYGWQRQQWRHSCGQTCFFCLLADISLSAGPLQQLLEHSKSKQKSTYAYYFTEEFTPSVELIPSPAWAPKRRADHGDDLTFVFGGVYMKNYFSGKHQSMLTSFYGASFKSTSNVATGFSKTTYHNFTLNW